ncbi:hypothetical protein [Nocardia donostiensis]|uniref:hypothetical protein n=1 Tax=Nocardia donostiensis TaxID=1538463 RepID=UPI00111565B1|nr:hypothetical protein [Nocardia donostiensis]
MLISEISERRDHRSPRPHPKATHHRIAWIVRCPLIGAAALALTLTACGTNVSTDEPTPTSTSPVSASPARATTSSAPAPATFETAEGAGDIGACFDGDCTVTVSAPTTIPIDAAVFGFPEVTISRVTGDSVTWEASGPGTFLRGTTGRGGTTTLSTGSSTPITMRPLSFRDGSATIEIFRGKP